MKNEPSLYNDYVLATLIGALIFAAGYFVRDFNSFDFSVPGSYDTMSATIPPPPGDVPPPPPPPAVSMDDEATVNAAAVGESDY